MSEENSQSPILWYLSLFLGLAFLLLIIKFRLFVILMPLGLVLFVLVPAFCYLYRQHKWRKVIEVVHGYEQLVSLLKKLQLNSYIEIVEKSMKRLLLARDRAEKFRDQLQRTKPDKLRKRVMELQKQLDSSEPGENQKLLEQSLKNSMESLNNIEKMKAYIQTFEESKKMLAEYYRNTLVKFELASVDEELGNSHQNDDMGRLIGDIQTFEAVYEAIDKDDPPIKRLSESE